MARTKRTVAIVATLYAASAASAAPLEAPVRALRGNTVTVECRAAGQTRPAVGDAARIVYRPGDGDELHAGDGRVKTVHDGNCEVELTGGADRVTVGMIAVIEATGRGRIPAPAPKEPDPPAFAQPDTSDKVPAGTAADSGSAQSLYEEASALWQAQPAQATAAMGRAAHLGHRLAQTWYGYALGTGHGIQKNRPEGLRWLLRGAEGGDAESYKKLGVAYAEAWGGESPDYAEACRWFIKGADAGDGNCMVEAAVCYGGGFGVAENRDRVHDLYRRAAALNIPAAIRAYGWYFEVGQYEKQDYAEAARWYRRAADMGDGQAQANLGNLYMQGRGVERDYEQGLSWLRKAVQQDNRDAMFSLGNAYEHGLGLPADRRQALDWFRKAQAAGYTGAAARLSALGGE